MTLLACVGPLAEGPGDEVASSANSIEAELISGIQVRRAEHQLHDIAREGFAAMLAEARSKAAP